MKFRTIEFRVISTIVGNLMLYQCIYSHPQTDCFVLSELFSVARHAGRSKPASKLVQLYDKLRLQTTRPQADYVGQGNF